MGFSAVESSVFRAFLGIVVGALGSGGAVMLTLRAFSNKDWGSVFRTYRSWLWMAPLPFLSVLAGREVTIALTSILSIFVFREFANATGLKNDRWQTRLVQLAIAAQAAFALLCHPSVSNFDAYDHFMSMPAWVIGCLAVVPIAFNRVEGQLHNVSLAVFGYLYFGWMFGHFAMLANLPNAASLLLYLLFAVSVNDVAAFTFGKLFGRRKLRDQISPNKTVAGSVGALAVSLVLPWMLRFALPGFTTIQLVLTGLLVGVGGQLGDLTISYIKRDLGMKDMGQLIPGHGGLLDRVDSLIFTAPLFFHMVRLFGV